ncbi:hypothetical protein DRH14_00665 [Candidatus Shapirobacteria bacterium]|nr:MAG: hypothetical protein DRH14_00665 [Candidatus Shapirobacteria bacterium]
MKKNITKLFLLLGLLGVSGFALSRAFFSDTEKSEGNVLSAGSLNLQISATTSKNGETAPSWDFTDLTNQKFFNFSSLMPGDYGVSTIGVKVFDTDAYACATIDNMIDDDVSCTTPEAIDEANPTCGGQGPATGELSSQIHFFAWDDSNNDGVWDSGESHLFSNIEGPASDILDGKTYPLNVPSTSALVHDQPRYISLYWCYGALTVDQNANTLTCDGSLVDNKSQTDSLTADISFNIEQADNNDDFSCN